MFIKSDQSIKLSLLLIAVILMIAACYPEANAQEQAKNCSSVNIDSYVRHMPGRSVDAISGKVGIIESEAEYSYELKAFDKLPMKFSLDTQYIGIENSVAVKLPSHLIGLSADIETTLPFFNFRETYLRLGVSPSFYSDDWDCEASSFRLPSRYFMIYKPNELWTFIAGVAIYPDFETEAWPILGFIYKPNDKLTFNLVPKRPNITYALNERVSLFAEGGIVRSEFEVDREGLENIVLSYKQARLGSGMEFKLNRYAGARVSAGGVFNRSLKYRNGTGKVSIDNGFYAEFRLKIEL